MPTLWAADLLREPQKKSQNGNKNKKITVLQPLVGFWVLVLASYSTASFLCCCYSMSYCFVLGFYFFSLFFSMFRLVMIQLNVVFYLLITEWKITAWHLSPTDTLWLFSVSHFLIWERHDSALSYCFLFTSWLWVISCHSLFHLLISDYCKNVSFEWESTLNNLSVKTRIYILTVASK